MNRNEGGPGGKVLAITNGEAPLHSAVIKRKGGGRVREKPKVG